MGVRGTLQEDAEEAKLKCFLTLNVLKLKKKIYGVEEKGGVLR